MTPEWVKKPPFEVDGQEPQARARRVALWLYLERGIPFASQRTAHLALLPVAEHEVRRRAVDWEMRNRAARMATGTPTSVYSKMVFTLRDADDALAASGTLEAFAEHLFEVPGPVAEAGEADRRPT